MGTDVIPETYKVKGIRRTIARRMQQSISSSAQLTLHTTIEIPELVSFKKMHPGITYTDLFVKATAMALMKHPRLNATFMEDTIQVWPSANIGLAVSLEDGLMVPAISEAETKTLAQIAEKRKDLINRAQTGQLTTEEVTSGTFTISNLGRSPVEAFTPILNIPQVALLGIGRIKEMPIAVGGTVQIVPVVYLSLTIDHRVVDGEPGAMFLQELENIFKEPEKF
jgi:pyruvate dehydrogenase E2 component (dihydrolipoamide acetyltransferase)